MSGAQAHLGELPLSPTYRSPLAWNSMLIVAKDFVGAARILHRKSRAMLGDTIQFVGKSALRARSADALDALAQRLSHGLGFGLAGQLGERAGKLFRLFVADVERHEITTCR